MSRTQTQIVIKGKDQASGVFQQTARRMNIELEGIKRRVFSLQGAFGALGVGLSAAAITRLASSAMDATAELEKSAKMAGVSLKAYQELRHAAAQYHVTQEALTDGLKELALRTDEYAKTGSGSAREAFERLGYTQGELNRKLHDTPALLQDVISRMEDLDKAAQIRIADEIFGGQGGEQFVAMIQGGSKALEELRQEAHELGVVMDKDMIRQSIEARRQIEKLTSVVSAQFNVAVAELAPDIARVSQRMTEWVGANGDFIAQQVEQKITAIASATGTAYDKISNVYGLWDGLPDDVKGAAGYGIVGGILFGKKGFALGALISGLIEPVQNIGRALAEIEAGNLSLQEFSTMNAKELADHFKFLDGTLKDVGQSSEVAKEQAFLMKLEYKDLINVLQESDLSDDYFSDAQYRVLVRRVMRLKKSTEDGTSAWERSGHAARDWSKTVQTEAGKAEGATEDYNEALKLVKDAWEELASTDEWEAQSKFQEALEKLGPDDPLVQNYLEALELIEQGTLNAHRAMAEGTGTDGWLRRETREVTDEQQKYFDERDRLQEEATRSAEEEARERQRAEERAAKESLRVWENMFDGIQDMNSEYLRDALDGTMRGIEDLADSILDIMKNTFAQVAAAALQTKIILPVMAQMMGGTGMGQAAQSMMVQGGGGMGLPGGGAMSWVQNNVPGMGFLGSTLPGTAGSSVTGAGGMGMTYGSGHGAMVGAGSGLSIGSAMGMGAIGGLGYSMLGPSLGLPQNQYTGITSGVGGALGAWGGSALTAGATSGVLTGATAGSVVPIVGTALGAIGGGLLGSLFGGSDRDELIGRADWHPDRGAYAIHDKFTPEAFAPGMQSAAFAKEVGKSVGIEIAGSVGFGVRESGKHELWADWDGEGGGELVRKFEDEDWDEISSEVFEKMLRSAEGVTDEIAEIFDRIDFSDIEQAASDIHFALDFDDTLAALSSGIEEMRQQIDAAAEQEVNQLIASLEQQAQTTARLGLSMQDLQSAQMDYVESLVLGRDSMTEVEAEVYALQSRFAELYKALVAVGYSSEDAARITEDGLAKAINQLGESASNTAELVRKRDQAASKYLKALQSEVNLLENDYNQAKSTYLDLLNDEVRAQEDVASATENAISTLKSYRQSLFIGQDSPATLSTQRSVLGGRMDDLTRRALAGDWEATQELVSVSDDYLGVSKQMHTDWVEYGRDIAKTANLTAHLEEQAADELSVAEKQLRELRDVIGGVNGVENRITDIDEARRAYEETKFAFDESWMRAEIEWLDGILGSNKSLEELQGETINAIKAIKAIEKTKDSYTSTSDSSSGSDKISREQAYLDANQDVQDAVEKGHYVSGWQHYVMWGRDEGRKFADGGIISGPTTGYTMPGATFHGNEAIVPLPDGNSIPVQMDNTELVAEIRKLRASVERYGYQTAKNTHDMRKVLRRAEDVDGLRVREVAS